MLRNPVPQQIYVRRNASLLSSMAFVALVAAGIGLGANPAVAICLLSFWHYYFYGLAYFYGSVPLGVFKRDAIAMKTVSLIALACVYLASPPDLLSLAVVAAGFLLNSAAARALGSDRTYYGHEVAGLPRLQITAFPYSWISHPMLAGNIAAFGGTMINAQFREQWWPLACAHVAANLGLLAMETIVKPRCRGARRAPGGEAGACAHCCSMPSAARIVAAGALPVGGLGYCVTSGTHALLGFVMGAGAFIYAFVIFCSYSSPTMPAGERRATEAEDPA